MGFSTLQTALIQMPSGGVQTIVCCGACYLASKFPNAIAGHADMPGTIPCWNYWYLVDPTEHTLWSTGVLLDFVLIHSHWTLSMSVGTANTAGHTKKVRTNAILLIGYCLGNFIGPFFFIADQAPRYNLGVGMMFFCIGVQVLSISSIWILLGHRNKLRALVDTFERGVLEGYENGFRNMTDLENLHFRYVY